MSILGKLCDQKKNKATESEGENLKQYRVKFSGRQKMSESVGCPLCSALACALAKATGKPVTIENEEQDGKTTKIQYRIMKDSK